MLWIIYNFQRTMMPIHNFLSQPTSHQKSSFWYVSYQHSICTAWLVLSVDLECSPELHVRGLASRLALLGGGGPFKRWGLVVFLFAGWLVGLVWWQPHQVGMSWGLWSLPLLAMKWVALLYQMLPTMKHCLAPGPKAMGQINHQLRSPKLGVKINLASY